MYDLPDRVRQRLAATGKSAAAASLEAGLGRSAIQNILSGASSSPRATTLIKLAKVLDCPAEYFMGLSDDPSKGVREADRPTLQSKKLRYVFGVEAGAFRSQGLKLQYEDDRAFSYSDARYGDEPLSLYEMMDDSMHKAGLYKGDRLSVVQTFYMEEIPLLNGYTFIIEQWINGKTLLEVTARRVDISGNKVSLICLPRTDEVDPILIDPGSPLGSKEGLRNTFESENGTMVHVVGPVARIIRSMPALPMGD